MTHLGSHDTKFYYEDGLYSVVLGDGTVVVVGRKVEEPSSDGDASDDEGPRFGPDAFHVFRASPTEWTKLKQLPTLCEHVVCDMSPVTTGNQELLAVSCWMCGVIRLLNLETGESSTAFRDPRYKPRCMCEGEEGQIFVDCREKGNGEGMILLLEWSASGLSIIRYIPVDKSMPLECYIPKHRLLMTCDYCELEATSSEDGKMQWELDKDTLIHDSFPRAAYSPTQDALLVSSDDPDNAISVLNAADGVLRQVFQRPQNVGGLHEMRLHNDQLILLYEPAVEDGTPDESDMLKIGFFSLE